MTPMVTSLPTMLSSAFRSAWGAQVSSFGRASQWAARGAPMNGHARSQAPGRSRWLSVQPLARAGTHRSVYWPFSSRYTRLGASFFCSKLVMLMWFQLFQDYSTFQHAHTPQARPGRGSDGGRKWGSALDVRGSGESTKSTVLNRLGTLTRKSVHFFHPDSLRIGGIPRLRL